MAFSYPVLTLSRLMLVCITTSDLLGGQIDRPRSRLLRDVQVRVYYSSDGTFSRHDAISLSKQTSWISLGRKLVQMSVLTLLHN
jgi:hypothetical protein